MADPLQSYAYAATLANTPQRPNLEWILSESASSLDGRQIAEAQAQGRRIYEQCCAKR